MCIINKKLRYIYLLIELVALLIYSMNAFGHRYHCIYVNQNQYPTTKSFDPISLSLSTRRNGVDIDRLTIGIVINKYEVSYI